MEKCGKVYRLAPGFAEPRMPTLTMRACSACAGDYEDPARTTGPDDYDDAGDAAGEDELGASEWELDPFAE